MRNYRYDEVAFPHDQRTTDHHGLTVREYFIAAAMQGLLSASHGPGCLLPNAIQQIAIDAVTVADAALAEAAK
jgi:hypothetical protein